MIYTATISSTPLRFRETRIVADLLLQHPSDEAWKEAIVEKNVLQVSSTIGVIRSSNILRARLEPMARSNPARFKGFEAPKPTASARSTESLGAPRVGFC